MFVADYNRYCLTAMAEKKTCAGCWLHLQILNLSMPAILQIIVTNLQLRLSALRRQ